MLVEVSPENERAVVEQLPKSDDPIELKHFFYFESLDAANALGELFRSRGISVSVDRSADDSSWGVYVRIAELITPTRIDEIRIGFEEIAEDFGGEYDGWEVVVAATL